MNLNRLYTPKQIEILKRTNTEDFFILGLHGAKRTGKTVINNDIFLRELIRVRKIADKLKIKEPMYILAGVSSKTIQNNVLQEIYNRYQLDIKFDKHNSFTLFGVKVVQAFTGTIGGLGGIRGMTAFGAYVNEASLANEKVFKEIISRCSGDGARIVFDTNPDNPEHWLKKEYIDSKSDNIISYHFELDDNTFLSPRYIQNIKESTPSGMFYDRDIRGLWVTGEGVVYSDFDSDKHFINDVDNIEFETYIAGVDWGYSHFGSIVVFGIDKFNNWYLLEEHAKQFKEIDYWADVALDIKARYGNINFYCDSARPEHVERFRRERIRAINADKSVLSGIEEVARLIKLGRFFVVSDKVKVFKKEIYNYVWDEKTGNPVKENDDVMDSMRYAIYSHMRLKARRKGADR
jgi:phage terminase, large subunit, PBSX family|nr:MAG TPA: large terminase [Caudoviricetes sp.]